MFKFFLYVNILYSPGTKVFLPLDDVKNDMEYLKQNIPAEADDFLIYFQSKMLMELLKE